MEYENILGGMQILTKFSNYNKNSKLKKGHNSIKMLDTANPSCLQVGVMMVNKSAKFQSQVSMDFEDILLYFIVNLG
jgi:hypothetical protein